MTDIEPNELADLLAPFWSQRRTCEALGISVEQLAEEVAARRVLGLGAPGRTKPFFPVEQFERASDGRIRVKPGLVGFMTGLKSHEPWTIGVALKLPMEELDDLTPLDWLRDGGEPVRLVEAARILNSEWR